MTSKINDLRLAELLASRLCHDLVGPISAISNGMELLEEGMEELDEEAKRLVGDSAEQASSALQFFRIAFGFGATPMDDPGQLRRLLEPFLANRKASLDWADPLEAVALPAGWGKLLLNLAALSLDALPMGGRIEISAQPLAGAAQLRCLAVGRDAELRADVAAGLDPDATVDRLTPRSVQAYFTAQVALALGGRLVAEQESPERYSLSAIV